MDEHSLGAQRMPGIIALLTDFGTADGYVGVMKGVMLGIAPQARFVDLTHEVPPQDIATGAWLLSTAWSYFPLETVFLGVVDPGVGTARRAIALAAGGRYFVGPDNGLASYVLAETPASSVALLTNPRFHLPNTSATFHGRDIFAPSAAHLAAGIPLDMLGAQAAPDTLVTIAPPRPSWRGDELVATVLHVDHFGNLITTLDPALTAQALAAPALALTVAGQTITARAATFGEGPEGAPFALRDSSGHLAIAVRNGSAAALLGAGRGAEVRVRGVARAG